MRGFFWIGAESRAGAEGTATRGQMYVEWETPAAQTQPFPVVLVHGGGGQGLNYMGTPDGRPGWMQLLVERGYAVYVVDRPGHGRSPLEAGEPGTLTPAISAEGFLALFAPPETAQAHTQWPFGRTPDDPGVLALTAALGPMLADWAEMHALEQSRLAALLDRIGPAVIVCHSAGGPAGYLAADARPELVRALVAVETVGPPFARRPGAQSLAWGLAAAPLTFEPPAAQPSDLRLVTTREGPVPLTLQAEPARTLPNLARVPIAVVTAAASPFARFDGHLIAFLRQAGCRPDLLRLADHGVHGNGHGMMFERNNDQVLDVILGWLRARLGPAA